MDGWTRGGCGLLAEAIARWLPRVQRKIVVCNRPNTHHVCHVAAVRDGVVVDGYGITSDFDEQIQAIAAIHADDDAGWFEGDEMLPVQTVELWHTGNARDFERYSDIAVEQLVQALRERFGDQPHFVPHRVTREGA